MLQLSKILIFLLLIFLSIAPKVQAQEKYFSIQAIDTMKISRDVAREKKNDTSFATYIDTVTKNIADTGATHIALGTPYDNEFLPFLNKWVQSARKHNLHVWFRGNFSGWEEWFDYERIDRETHMKKTEAFILSNPQLFQDGDIFSSCPECENGGPGDPRNTGDEKGFRTFIIQEYQLTKKSFEKINKKVQSNAFSMNGDVAKLIMNKPTTMSLDGLVVIDHYVKTPKQTIDDINYLAEQSGGKVMLGEFGVPIPDIHGDMSEDEQSQWIDELFKKLVENPHVVGLNYWTSSGSSTELWHDDNTPKKIVATLKKYYAPFYVKGAIIDAFGTPIAGAKIMTGAYHTTSNEKGEFTLLYTSELKRPLTIEKKGYVTEKITVETNNQVLQFITLKAKEPSIFAQLLAFLRMFFNK